VNHCTAWNWKHLLNLKVLCYFYTTKPVLKRNCHEKMTWTGDRVVSEDNKRDIYTRKCIYSRKWHRGNGDSLDAYTEWLTADISNCRFLLYDHRLRNDWYVSSGMLNELFAMLWCLRICRDIIIIILKPCYTICYDDDDDADDETCLSEAWMLPDGRSTIVRLLFRVQPRSRFLSRHKRQQHCHYSFWQNPLTWQTDRKTDRHTPHEGIGRTYA